jgi:hypothetical protein
MERANRLPSLLGWVLGLSLSLAAGAGAARAQEDTRPPEVRAREHAANGEKAYKRKQFETAAREFEDAYRLWGQPAHLYNLAQSHRHAGNHTKAMQSYQAYLQVMPNAPNRADIEGHITKLEAAQGGSPAAAAPAGPPPAPAQFAPPPAPSYVPPPQASAPPAAPARAPASRRRAAAPAGPAGRDDGSIRVLATMPLHENSDLPEAVRQKCRGFGSVLPSSLARADRRINLVNSEAELTARGGRHLQIQVLEVRAKGGGVFSGPKQITLRAVLYERGQEIADVEMRRGSTMAFSTCSSLEKVEAVLGQDLARWLNDPRPGDRL